MTLDELAVKITSIPETAEQQQMTINLGTSVSDDPLSHLLMVFDACPGKVKFADVGATLLAQDIEKKTYLDDFIGRDADYNKVVQTYHAEPNIHPMLASLAVSPIKSG